MRRKLLFLPIVITVFLFWVSGSLFVRAEDDGEENEVETEDSYEYAAPPVEQPVAPVPAPVPVVAPVPVPDAPVTSVQKVQYVDKLIQETIVPPIVVTDNNENGIVDEIERLYKK